MNTISQADLCPVEPSGRAEPMTVVALHCSGANGNQWAHLATHFARHFDRDTDFIAPNLAGPEAAAAGWTMQSYSLAEESRPLLDHILGAPRPVHLVGHSYGGALALHIARRYPKHVASLCLYEPTSFSLLARSDADDLRLYREVETLAASFDGELAEGHAAFVAEVFTDFWGGLGAWLALRPDRRKELMDWVPKAALDYGALLYEPQGAKLPDWLPMTLLSGAQTTAHAKRIVALLADENPQADLVELEGAGHLGPFTFRDKVADIIKQHIEQVCCHNTRAK